MDHPLIKPEDVEEWRKDCLHYLGVVLTGQHAHWCFDWDGLPVDETCEYEWPCSCFEGDQ